VSAACWLRDLTMVPDGPFPRDACLWLQICNCTRFNAENAKSWPIAAPKLGGGVEAKSVVYLHTKLFQNYRMWCKRMLGEEAKVDKNGVKGKKRCFIHFDAPAPLDLEARTAATPLSNPKTRGMLYDLMLSLLIWGEAANLRHMPECLCWLFYQISTTYMALLNKDASTRLPGFFVSEVVAPIYTEVVKAGKKGGDHDSRRNYDDFNEFFWRIECLKYSCFSREALKDFGVKDTERVPVSEVGWPT
jgi:hypothetical protein